MCTYIYIYTYTHILKHIYIYTYIHREDALQGELPTLPHRRAQDGKHDRLRGDEPKP